MQKLKIGDEVMVIAGRDKRKTGTAKSINRKKGTIIVEGRNLVKKAVRKTEQNPLGGHPTIEAPLPICNVALVSPKTKKPTKVRIEKRDGKNIRVAVSCGTELKYNRKK